MKRSFVIVLLIALGFMIEGVEVQAELIGPGEDLEVTEYSFEELLFDEYDVVGDVVVNEDTISFSIEPLKEIDEITYLPIETDYEYVGENRKGRYMGSVDVYRSSRREDFVSGDYFYEFHVGWNIFSHNDDYHKKYEIYDTYYEVVTKPRYYNLYDFDNLPLLKGIHWDTACYASKFTWDSVNNCGMQHTYRLEQYFVSSHELVKYIEERLHEWDDEFEETFFDYFLGRVMDASIAMLFAEEAAALTAFIEGAGATSMAHPALAFIFVLLMGIQIRDEIATAMANDDINNFLDVIQYVKEDDSQLVVMDRISYHARTSVGWFVEFRAIDDPIVISTLYSENGNHRDIGDDVIFGSVEYIYNEEEIMNVIDEYFSKYISILPW